MGTSASTCLVPVLCPMNPRSSSGIPNSRSHLDPDPQADYVPTPQDVFTVRGYLLAKVPAELANVILEEASYWPKVSCKFTPEGGDCIVQASSTPGNDASFCCLVSPRLKEWIITNEAPSSKVKQVCFTIVSHDQGWASEDDFPGAFDLS